MKHDNCDFSGCATRNDLMCEDGVTIRKNAFKCNDGQKVPLVYNHEHGDLGQVLGHAILENRDDGVYAYCYLNNTEEGRTAKELVKHGDISSLSIYANRLKKAGNDIIHGIIREVSLVLAGANPGAFIDTVLSHSADSEDGMIVGYNENLVLYHSADSSKDGEDKGEDKVEKTDKTDKTVQDVINTMNEEQKNVMFALIAEAIEDNDEGGEDNDMSMKHNIFENDEQEGNYLTHSDEQSIIALAKNSNVGSFQNALAIYVNDNDKLQHGIDPDDMNTLFPEYKDGYPGEPETITRDLTWIDKVISSVHKSPITRVRTRQLDARQTGIRAKGYKKGTKKTEIGNVKLLSRTTDPQTVYVKDKLERDDIVDFTDFALVDYTYKTMRMALDEELAIAIMIGD